MLEPTDYYRNGLEQKNKELIFRDGSPISDLSLKDLPSPRMIIDGTHMKNA